MATTLRYIHFLERYVSAAEPNTNMCLIETYAAQLVFIVHSVCLLSSARGKAVIAPGVASLPTFQDLFGPHHRRLARDRSYRYQSIMENF